MIPIIRESQLLGISTEILGNNIYIVVKVASSEDVIVPIQTIEQNNPRFFVEYKLISK